MNRRYWIDVAERTARTFVQGFLGVVTVNAFTTLNASWTQLVLTGLASGAYAVLTSFAAATRGSSNDASFREP